MFSLVESHLMNHIFLHIILNVFHQVPSRKSILFIHCDYKNQGFIRLSITNKHLIDSVYLNIYWQVMPKSFKCNSWCWHNLLKYIYWISHLFYLWTAYVLCSLFWTIRIKYIFVLVGPPGHFRLLLVSCCWQE
jgi:hypothetical protein